MADLDRDTLKNLTQLSRIDLGEEESEKLIGSLAGILEYVAQLQEVDTEGVPPCNHVISTMTSTMRADEIGETLNRDTFLDNSPSHVGGMIRVPPVIKQG